MASIPQPEPTQYQKVTSALSAFGRSLQWPTDFMAPLNKTISLYRLRIDDEINKDFQSQLEAFLQETDKEVQDLLRKKRLKIENSLKALQNNDLKIYLRMMQTFSLQLKDKFQFNFAINSICGSPDGKVFLGGNNKQVLKICPDKSHPPEVYFSHTNSLQQLFSDSQGRVVSAWEDGTLRLHEGPSSAKLLPGKAQGSTAKMLAINPQKTVLFFLQRDNPRQMHSLCLSSLQLQDYSLPEGEYVQLAANQSEEVFILDKKGTVHKLTLAGGQLQSFPPPDKLKYTAIAANHGFVAIGASKQVDYTCENTVYLYDNKMGLLSKDSSAKLGGSITHSYLYQINLELCLGEAFPLITAISYNNERVLFAYGLEHDKLILRGKKLAIHNDACFDLKYINDSYWTCSEDMFLLQFSF